MYTLTPGDIAEENGDPFTRFGASRYHYYAPGMVWHTLWRPVLGTDANGLPHTAMLTPMGIHNLLMFPFLLRNPDPVERPSAWNFGEAMLAPLENGEYSLPFEHYHAGSYNRIYTADHQELTFTPGTYSYNHVDKWREGSRYLDQGKTLPAVYAVAQELITLQDPDTGSWTNHYLDLNLEDHEWLYIAALLDDLEQQVDDKAARRVLDFGSDGMTPTWAPGPTRGYPRSLNTDELRRPLFNTARKTAVSLGLDVEDELHYLEGIDEQLGVSFLWYLPWSLIKTLKRSDWYKTRAKKEREFMGSISEIRMPLWTHRADMANALVVLWFQRAAEKSGNPLPYTQDEVNEARAQFKQSLQGLVRWYLTFPAAYEDLVVSYGGPSSALVVPDGIDYDERLQIVRNNLSAERRARHLLRSS